MPIAYSPVENVSVVFIFFVARRIPGVILNIAVPPQKSAKMKRARKKMTAETCVPKRTCCLA